VVAVVEMEELDQGVQRQTQAVDPVVAVDVTTTEVLQVVGLVHVMVIQEQVHQGQLETLQQDLEPVAVAEDVAQAKSVVLVELDQAEMVTYQI
jgi:hypothetical protein